jgi:membrane-bound inhibitor of C-type lysozyme
MIVLHQGVSGSGARYEWPSGGSGYVWWSKGDEATLLWKDGASGEEAPVLSACKALS